MESLGDERGHRGQIQRETGGPHVLSNTWREIREEDCKGTAKRYEENQGICATEAKNDSSKEGTVIRPFAGKGAQRKTDGGMEISANPYKSRLISTRKVRVHFKNPQKSV